MLRWPPDLQQLATLVAVAEEGSFTKAAARLRLTPQGVGGQIRKLEQLVDKRLFDRTTHEMRLTPDGEALVLYARMMLNVSETARRFFAHGRLDGTVRLGVIEACAGTGLVSALQQVRTVSQRLEIVTRTAETKVLLELLEAGSIDLMIGAQRAGAGQGEVLFRDPLRWVGASPDLVRRGEPVPLVLHTDNSVLRGLALEALAGAGWTWQVLFEGDSHASLQAAVLAGLGVSGVSTFMAGSAQDAPELAMPGLPAMADTEVFMRVRPGADRFVQSFSEILRIIGPALAEIRAAGQAEGAGRPAE